MPGDVNKDKRQIASEDVPIFLNAREKLLCFHTEVAKLSNKKPDGPLSKFKLGFINQVLEPLNRILGEDFRPFPDFTTFDVEGSMPSASDALMMLSQYEAAMKRFETAHKIVVTKPERTTMGEFRKVVEWNTGQPADQTKMDARGGDDEDESEADYDEDEEDDNGEDEDEDEDDEGGCEDEEEV